MATLTLPDHIKGDTFPGQQFTVLVNEAPLPLAGAVITMDLRKDERANSERVLRLSTTLGTISIINAAGGVFQINKQIIDIPAKQYNYDIEIVLANGDVKTYISGTWTILQDITHG